MPLPVVSPEQDLEVLTRFRRDLHRIPELDFDLPQTIAYVRGVLEGLSCQVTSPCKSCVCAYFDVDRAAGRVPGGLATAVRADMDALPICEKSGAPFASQHEGRMHACGHDGHMAMALAAACWVDAVLKAGPQAASALPRNVLFVFQPAEETTGGAKTVCESGVFERYRVDRIFGFHLWPDLPAGVIASRPGALLARSSETTLTVRGVSSHIAKHREGRDALLAAAWFVCAADRATTALNAEDAEDPCLLKFGHLVSGTVRNAIAADAVVEGSLRVFSEEMFARAKDAVRTCAEEACGSCGCTYDLHFSEGYPAVVNDRALFELVARGLGADATEDGAKGDAESVRGVFSRGPVVPSASAASACVSASELAATVSAAAPMPVLSAAEPASVPVPAPADAASGEGAASERTAANGAAAMPPLGLRLLPEPLLIAEDFAFYQKHLPGVFLLLGTGTGIPLHADAFNFDERVLTQGLAAYRRLIAMR